jgi:hypothetical protein
MKTASLFSAFSLLLYMVVISCGSATYKLAGRTLKQSKIVDSGELYSSYDMSKDEKKELIAAGLLDGQIRRIETQGMETNWPKGISTLDMRDTNRDKIANYVSYKVATISGGDIVVLVLPASKNKHMPADMRFPEDIYFFMGKNGVQ